MSAQQQINEFSDTASYLQMKLLAILAQCKQMPEEAPEALATVDLVISVLLASQNALSSGKELLEPSVQNAQRVRNEIALLCPKDN